MSRFSVELVPVLRLNKISVIQIALVLVLCYSLAISFLLFGARGTREEGEVLPPAPETQGEMTRLLDGGHGQGGTEWPEGEMVVLKDACVALFL